MNDHQQQTALIEDLSKRSITALLAGQGQIRQGPAMGVSGERLGVYVSCDYTHERDGAGMEVRSQASVACGKTAKVKIETTATISRGGTRLIREGLQYVIDEEAVTVDRLLSLAVSGAAMVCSRMTMNAKLAQARDYLPAIRKVQRHAMLKGDPDPSIIVTEDYRTADSKIEFAFDVPGAIADGHVSGNAQELTISGKWLKADGMPGLDFSAFPRAGMMEPLLVEKHRIAYEVLWHLAGSANAMLIQAMKSELPQAA